MVVLQLLACAFTDEPQKDAVGRDDTGGVGARTVEVRVVAPDGTPVDLAAVGWFDPARLPVPLRPAITPMVCAEGAPPCAVWVADRPLPERIQVVAEHFGEESWVDETGFTCFPWDSPWTTARVPRDAAAQVVHLVVDSEQTWCDDGVTAQPVPALVPPTVHAADERLAFDEPVAQLTVDAVDVAGIPLPLAVVSWYYAPQSAEYDGEHLLTCANALCSSWVIPAGEGPAEGAFYVSGTWAGPLHPTEDVTWTDYVGSPTDGVASVELQFDTTVAVVVD